MKTLFDNDGNLDIQEIIMSNESFKKIIFDGKVTPEEIRKQSEKVKALLHKADEMLNEEQTEVIKELLAEMSVLIAINQL